MDTLQNRLKSVAEKIHAAALRAGRDPKDITLVAVSKTHPTAMVNAAIDAGQTVFGENKVQEAEPKIGEVGRERAEWHLIGHLQSNKARKAVQLFDVIQSVDSLELARRLERICTEENRAELRILVQVDLAAEPTKSGIAEAGLSELLDYLKLCRRLRFEGLMILPPYFQDPGDVRPYFRRLRELRDRLAAEDAFRGNAGHLSMGMSHDFEIAIEEGATIVRVGTALFGERTM